MKSNPNFGFFKINGESKLFPFLRFIFVAFLASFFFTAFTGCGKNKEDHFEPYFKENLFWINFPIILHADARFIEDPKSGEDLRVAIRFWEKKAGRRLFQISPKPSHFSPFSNPLNPNYSLENSIFFLNPWPFDHEVAGKTLVQMNGPKIQHAVIYLNSETALCHSLCNGEGEEGQTSQRKLIAHELGHLLGFDHVPDRGNLMYPTILPGGSLENLRVDESLLPVIAARPQND